MRLRTKLFITWGGLVFLLWAGTLWPVQRTISSNLDDAAVSAFSGTLRGLDAVRAERMERMRQASRLVMNIPELRALIAEHSFEISPDNVESLRERLDGLSDIVEAGLVCVLDSRGELIAQNHASPWPTLDGLRAFLASSPHARAPALRVFAGDPGGGAGEGVSGLWVNDRALYDVVAVPLVFAGADEGDRAEADGALVMATAVNDELASQLGRSHSCRITFLAESGVAASSVPADGRRELEALLRARQWRYGGTFEVELGGEPFRCSLEPMRDPCSGAPAGAVLVQSSLAGQRAVQAGVSRTLLAILVTGLFAAAVGSYALSGAVTRPVADLVRAVRDVAQGNLDHSLRARSRDELGQLASAFNDMVGQLRTRRELQRLVEESQAASRAKSRFLANMSHEIRTPLNGVVGMSELLLSTGLDDRQRRYASLVKSSAEVLTTLINDVLDFSKIEAGKMELESVPFDVRAVVEDVAELMAPKAISKRLHLVCDAGGDVPGTVRGDPNRVRQVLINLLNNALKFTERGEVIVGVKRQSLEEGRLTARFWVTDTGIGIPPDRLDRLFKSFSQVDASTTRKYGGTGLGLAISRQLAELMGGSIGVESRPGRGSTFWFTAQFGLVPGAEATDCSEVSPQRVLICEPHAPTRDMLTRRLAEWGMESAPSHGGDEAAAAVAAAHAEGHPFSLALLADHEQGMTGMDLGSLLKRCPGGESIGLLLLARTDFDLDVARLREAGFAGYITKPVRRAQLLDALLEAREPGRKKAAPAPAPGITASPAAPGAPTRGRVLLAEDNEVNQLVVADMLAFSGYACDVVKDGVEAVEAARRGVYDLILMDCQMPRMDGFEATERIRAEERAAPAGAGARRVPIVALTANAVAGDRQRCMDAGMDGYCTKPVEKTRLIETLEKFVQGRGGAPPIGSVPGKPAPTATPAAPPTAARAESDVLDMDALMRRCSGKRALAESVLDTFVQQMNGTLENLRAGAESRDAAAIARAAHGLKGTAGMAGAAGVRSAAARLEDLGRSGDVSLAAQGLATLRAEVERCRELIRRSTHTPGPASPDHSGTPNSGTPTEG